MPLGLDRPDEAAVPSPQLIEAVKSVVTFARSVSVKVATTTLFRAALRSR